MNNLDVGAVVGSLSALLMYHCYSYGLVFFSQTKNIQLSRNIFNGLMWVAKHKENIDAASVTLAVHTLRNTILIAVFVGGCSFQYGFIYLNSYDTEGEFAMKIRSIILAVCLLSSFLCWVNVIRSASHLGYFVGALEYQEKAFVKEIESKHEIDASKCPVQSAALACGGAAIATAVEIRPPVHTELEPESLAECRRMMKTMLVSFSLGLRFMFISIPFIFYTVGPEALIVFTGLMLGFLYSLDHLELKNATFFC